MSLHRITIVDTPYDPLAEYYYGIASQPKVLASSLPPDQFVVRPYISRPTPKALYPIQSDHSLFKSWETNIAPRILEIINTELPSGPACLDAVRIGTSEGAARSFIWIGVGTGLMSEAKAKEMVVVIKELSTQLGVSDFEVEIRHITLSRFSKLLDPADFKLVALEYAEPYCHTLGTPMSTADRPDYLGTGSLLLGVPGFDHLFMLTAHHVVNSDPEARLDPSNSENRSSVRISTAKTYEKDRRLVDMVLGDHEATLSRLAERKSRGMVTRVDKSDGQYARSEKAKLGPWRKRLEAEYGTEELRTFGHTFAYPEMRPRVNADQSTPLDFAEDWALIQTDIQRGTRNLNLMNLCNWRAASDYELDPRLRSCRYLRLDGFLSSEDLAARSHNVLKTGAATGITTGITNPLKSFVRYHQAGSLEQGVLAVSECGGTFSGPADSGSTIIDNQGRICGLLTLGVSSGLGGADISYFTPMWWIMERMRLFGLDPSIV